MSSHPQRKDGGTWIAHGIAYPVDFDRDAYYRKVDMKYQVCGLRYIHSSWEGDESCRLSLHEYDTTSWDSICRSVPVGFTNYCKDICKLLFAAYKGVSPEGKVNSAMIEAIPVFTELGLFANIDGQLTCDVPVLTRKEYDEVIALCHAACEGMIKNLKQAYHAHLESNVIALPSHLKNVPARLRYSPAYNCFQMGVLYEAYERKLFLHDVHYCCPPVIMIVE